MKKFTLILLTLSLFVGISNAQDNPPKAAFDKTEHDFGKVKEVAGSVTTEFTFTNTGKSPLIIQRASASCGCTTPDYTKEPILPGKTGKIIVSYNTVGRPGSFNKTVTVFTNVPDEIYTLRIKGEVIPK